MRIPEQVVAVEMLPLPPQKSAVGCACGNAAATSAEICGRLCLWKCCSYLSGNLRQVVAVEMLPLPPQKTAVGCGCGNATATSVEICGRLWLWKCLTSGCGIFS